MSRYSLRPIDAKRRRFSKHNIPFLAERFRGLHRASTIVDIGVAMAAIFSELDLYRAVGVQGINHGTLFSLPIVAIGGNIVE